MRWKLFAILVAVSYVWAILTGFDGVPRSQFRMVGDACIGLFATIGVLHYAFERQLLSEQFWSWFSRLYLVWICLWLAVFLVRLSVFYSANTDLLSAKKWLFYCSLIPPFCGASTSFSGWLLPVMRRAKCSNDDCGVGR